MEKNILILASVLGIVIILGACSSLEPDNPKGKTIYYTEITDSGVQGEDERYDYELTAYNKDGEEKELEFSAGKQLEEGAYIKLYYAKFFGIRHWKEVSFDDMPEAVQQKYSE